MASARPIVNVEADCGQRHAELSLQQAEMTLACRDTAGDAERAGGPVRQIILASLHP